MNPETAYLIGSAIGWFANVAIVVLPILVLIWIVKKLRKRSVRDEVADLASMKELDKTLDEFDTFNKRRDRRAGDKHED